MRIERMEILRFVSVKFELVCQFAHRKIGARRNSGGLRNNNQKVIRAPKRQMRGLCNSSILLPAGLGELSENNSVSRCSTVRFVGRLKRSAESWMPKRC